MNYGLVFLPTSTKRMANLCRDVEANETCRCLARECPKVFNHSQELKEQCFMDTCFISKRALDDTALIQVTSLYVAILVIGLIGNLTTCIVIRRHPLLKTHSSAYLFNLALSDLVTLCVGLPFEIFMNWHQYPWPFPDFVCNLKAWIAETTCCVSILTILLFSIERYTAICHPFYFVKLRPLRDNVFWLLASAWVISLICAAPYGFHHRADYLLKSWPYDTESPPEPVLSSKMCMIGVYYDSSLVSTFHFLFHFSAIVFFVVPLLIILILYLLIAFQMKMRRRGLQQVDSSAEEGNFKVTFILTSVVCAFFICYLPFQMQRLLFFYVNDSVILGFINQYIYFISGFLFYLATIVNPILYNLVSGRFRTASKEVIMSLLIPGRNTFSKASIKYTLSTSTQHFTSRSLDKK